MSIQLRPLRNQVIVITGTSSGIGLVTARMAAEAGARVVLVGRDEMTNRNLALEIHAQGGQAIYVIADVGKQQDVDRIAADAIEACGTFNTWINNACVSIFGRWDEALISDIRQIDAWASGDVHNSLNRSLIRCDRDHQTRRSLYRGQCDGFRRPG